MKHKFLNTELTIIGALKPPLLIRNVSSSAFCLLINGDCVRVMAENDLGWDAIVTDPPYGLKKELKRGWHGGNGKTKFHSENSWDEKLNSFVEQIAKEDEQVILWGGNFYNLPPTDTWLIWDKLQDNRGSDAEMAWGKLKKRGCRVFRMSRIDAYFNKRIFPKEHPTEKPIQLMEFCVSKTSGVVIDPFMGVGSTGLACLNLNRSFVGIEKDENYYDRAVRRITEESKKHCY